MMVWLDAFLSDARWWRRLRGGHWEHLYLKPTGNEGWFRGPHPRRVFDAKGWSPEVLDACEDWG